METRRDNAVYRGPKGRPPRARTLGFLPRRVRCIRCVGCVRCVRWPRPGVRCGSGDWRCHRRNWCRGRGGGPRPSLGATEEIPQSLPVRLRRLPSRTAAPLRLRGEHVVRQEAGHVATPPGSTYDLSRLPDGPANARRRNGRAAPYTYRSRIAGERRRDLHAPRRGRVTRHARRSGPSRCRPTGRPLGLRLPPSPPDLAYPGRHTPGSSTADTTTKTEAHHDQ